MQVKEATVKPTRGWLSLVNEIFWRPPRSVATSDDPPISHQRGSFFPFLRHVIGEEEKTVQATLEIPSAGYGLDASNGNSKPLLSGGDEDASRAPATPKTPRSCNVSADATVEHADSNNRHSDACGGRGPGGSGGGEGSRSFSRRRTRASSVSNVKERSLQRDLPFIWTFLKDTEGWGLAGNSWNVRPPRVETPTSLVGGWERRALAQEQLPAFLVEHPELLERYRQWRERMSRESRARVDVVRGSNRSTPRESDRSPCGVRSSRRRASPSPSTPHTPALTPPLLPQPMKSLPPAAPDQQRKKVRGWQQQREPSGTDSVNSGTTSVSRTTPISASKGPRGRYGSDSPLCSGPPALRTRSRSACALASRCTSEPGVCSEGGLEAERVKSTSVRGNPVILISASGRDQIGVDGSGDSSIRTPLPTGRGRVGVSRGRVKKPKDSSEQQVKHVQRGLRSGGKNRKSPVVQVGRDCASPDPRAAATPAAASGAGRSSRRHRAGGFVGGVRAERRQCDVRRIKDQDNVRHGVNQTSNQSIGSRKDSSTCTINHETRVQQTESPLPAPDRNSALLACSALNDADRQQVHVGVACVQPPPSNGETPKVKMECEDHLSPLPSEAATPTSKTSRMSCKKGMSLGGTPRPVRQPIWERSTPRTPNRVSARETGAEGRDDMDGRWGGGSDPLAPYDRIEEETVDGSGLEELLHTRRRDGYLDLRRYRKPGWPRPLRVTRVEASHGKRFEEHLLRLLKEDRRVEAMVFLRRLAHFDRHPPHLVAAAENGGCGRWAASVPLWYQELAGVGGGVEEVVDLTLGEAEVVECLDNEPLDCVMMDVVKKEPELCLAEIAGGAKGRETDRDDDVEPAGGPDQVTSSVDVGIATLPVKTEVRWSRSRRRPELLEPARQAEASIVS